MRTSWFMPPEQVQWVATQVWRGCTYATIEQRIGMPAGSLGQVVHHCRAGRHPWARPIVEAVDGRGGPGSSAVLCDDNMTIAQARAQRERQRIERRKRPPNKRDERAPPKPNPLAWTDEQIEAAATVLRDGGTRADAAATCGRSAASISRAIEKARLGNVRFAPLTVAVEEGKRLKAQEREAALDRIAERIRQGALLHEACADEALSRATALAHAKDHDALGDALDETRTDRLRAAQAKATPRKERRATVYIIGAVAPSGDLAAFKVGHTNQAIKHRRKKLQIGNPLELVILDTRPGTVAAEKALHKRLERYHLRGEWFAAKPEALKIAGVSWKQS